MKRLILALIALALCLMAGGASRLDVSANVVGVLRSDVTLLIPNRYATAGRFVLPQSDGYRVTLADVDRPEWRFSVMASGSSGMATFGRDEWAFQSSGLLRAAAESGRLTVVAGP